jgi:hypothetical protein
MATSRCPKCASSSFELENFTPRNSEFKLSFVQCSSCGAVVGVLDYYNIGQLIHDLAKKLNVHL